MFPNLSKNRTAWLGGRVRGESRLLSGTGRGLAKEAFRIWSCKIDRNDYSSNCSDNSADETHLAAVENLSYSKPY